MQQECRTLRDEIEKGQLEKGKSILGDFMLAQRTLEETRNFKCIYGDHKSYASNPEQVLFYVVANSVYNQALMSELISIYNDAMKNVEDCDILFPLLTLSKAAFSDASDPDPTTETDDSHANVYAQFITKISPAPTDPFLMGLSRNSNRQI